MIIITSSSVVVIIIILCNPILNSLYPVGLGLHSNQDVRSVRLTFTYSTYNNGMKGIYS